MRGGASSSQILHTSQTRPAGRDRPAVQPANARDALTRGHGYRLPRQFVAQIPGDLRTLTALTLVPLAQWSASAPAARTRVDGTRNTGHRTPGVPPKLPMRCSSAMARRWERDARRPSGGGRIRLPPVHNPANGRSAIPFGHWCAQPASQDACPGPDGPATRNMAWFSIRSHACPRVMRPIS